MTTSRTMTPYNSKNMDKLSRGELAYICSRNQFAAHNLLVRAIKESGFTQKQLSQLTGIDEASISRLLRRPRNMELNTFSKLFYAAYRAALSFAPSFPKQDSCWVFRSVDGRQNEDTAAFIIWCGDETKETFPYLTHIGSIHAWEEQLNSTQKGRVIVAT